MSESLDYKNYLFPLSALNIYEFLYWGNLLHLILHFKTAGFLLTPIYGIFLLWQISIIFSLSSGAIRLPR